MYSIILPIIVILSSALNTTITIHYQQESIYIDIKYKLHDSNSVICSSSGIHYSCLFPMTCNATESLNLCKFDYLQSLDDRIYDPIIKGISEANDTILARYRYRSIDFIAKLVYRSNLLQIDMIKGDIGDFIYCKPNFCIHGRNISVYSNGKKMYRGDDIITYTIGHNLSFSHVDNEFKFRQEVEKETKPKEFNKLWFILIPIIGVIITILIVIIAYSRKAIRYYGPIEISFR